MRRAHAFALLALSSFAAAAACGGISDPTRSTGTAETTATITGKLTGTAIPAGARVALVWGTKEASRVHVGADVAVVGNAFTMTLATPPESCFRVADEELSSSSSAPGTDPMPPPTVTEDVPGSSSSGSSGSSGTSSSGGSSGASSSGSSGASGSTSGSPAPSGLPPGIRPLGEVSGTVVTQPLNVAVAGFVIYEDTNGNGKLDLATNDELSSAGDTLLGGNRELVIAVLRDGGALDYEKLRDNAGILPVAGFNLMWSEKSRWLPLNTVELKLAEKPRLPSAVCSLGGDVAGTEEPRPDVASPSVLHCSEDGRSYYYESPPCVEPPPPVPGLCSSGYSSWGCGGTATPASPVLAPGEPVPPYWPCEVNDTAVDAGAEDSGIHTFIDAGAPDAN